MLIKRINKATRPVFKNHGELNIGDFVLTPEGKKEILQIHDQGISKVYKITLSNGESYRTNSEHLNTLSFRKNEEGYVWENIDTQWVLKNLENFTFMLPSTEDVLSFSDDNRQRISTTVSPQKLLSSESIKDRISTRTYISKIERVEDENTKCISLDYDLGLYYIGNWIITHNTFCSAISILYITTHLVLMRNPKKIFGISQATSIVHALISFTMEKAGQLLLQPFYQILLSSKKFHRVRQEEKLVEKQKEYPDKICWTSAGKIGQLQFTNDIHAMLASSPQKLLGLSMISAVLSEISFFLDQGFSPDYIWRIYQDAKARIRSRFETKYFATTIIDSSPNDMEESPIDNFIFSGTAAKDPTNYVVTGAQWEFLPRKFEKWYATKETFPVFRGNANSAPAIIRIDSQRQEYNEDEIIDVPIDLKGLFEENLLKNIKDYAGWPAGSQGKLFKDVNIIDNMFSMQLRNIYSFIKAPDDQPAKGLIWGIVHKQFFIQHGKNQYEFYRAPDERRFMHIDQSETGDQTGISCVHVEMDKHGEYVYVTDFTIVIDPGKGRINLNAIPEFILDLRDKGKMKIEMISFDRYQSSSAIQYLKEKGFTVERTSVDISTKPYYIYMSLMNTKKIQSGKNIILKNNIRSLQEIKIQSGKKKIDHEKGDIIKDDGGDWALSMMGRNAKDASDSHCGAIWDAVHNFKGVPMYRWQYDSELSELFEDGKIPKKNAQLEIVKKKIMKKIHDQYSLKIDEDSHPFVITDEEVL